MIVEASYWQTIDRHMYTYHCRSGVCIADVPIVSSLTWRLDLRLMSSALLWPFFLLDAQRLLETTHTPILHQWRHCLLLPHDQLSLPLLHRVFFFLLFVWKWGDEGGYFPLYGPWKDQSTKVTLFPVCFVPVCLRLALHWKRCLTIPWHVHCYSGLLITEFVVS